jgi:hypothetical protein
MNWIEWVDKYKKDIRSVAIGVVSLSLGILFFGFYNETNLDMLFTFHVAGLSLVALVSIRLWRFDVRTIAFEDECETNEGIIAQEKQGIELITQPVDYESCLDYCDIWNAKEQKNANIRKTNKKITKLKNKRDRLYLIYSSRPNKLKNKQAKIDKHIARLQVKPLIDRKFKKVSVKQMLSGYKVKTSKDANGKTFFEYNPVTHGSKTSFLKSLIKFVGIGGSGGLVFNDLQDQWEQILVYYGLLILSMVLTLVFNYPVVRNLTKTNYLTTLTNKNEFRSKMLSHKKKPILMIEHKESE